MSRQVEEILLASRSPANAPEGRSTKTLRRLPRRIPAAPRENPRGSVISDPASRALGDGRFRSSSDENHPFTALQRFETYLNEHALSPATIRNYLADLRAFSRWHSARRPRALHFTAADFHAYREYLSGETAQCVASINRRLQALRLFGRFLFETGQVSANPTDGIELIPNHPGNGVSPRFLSAAEVRQLEEAIKSGRPSLVKRDYALMQLMLQAGLRVHEVAALRVRDLVMANRNMGVQVHGNGRSGQRVVPLNADAAGAVRDYLATRPALPRVEYLFLSQRGRPLSMRSIQRVIDTYARAAGLKGVCAQSLRNTCAKLLLEQTRDTARVAEWLGHQNPRALARYAKT